VDNGRNDCVRIAQEKGATHLFFLDSDMMFPGETLERLLSHKKEIVGCIYSRRVAPFTNLGTPKDKAMSKVGGDTVLLEMDMVATGCLLIDMSVFKRIDKPYFQRPMREINGQLEPMGEDVHFCERMRVAGYKLWADVPLSAHIGHIGTAVYKVHDGSKARAALVGQGQDRMIGQKSMEAAE
jgi:choline kinase